MTPLDLSVDAAADSARIKVRGELDVSSAPTLRDLIVRLVSEGRTNLVLDCDEIGFVDSTGLGVFVGARARALAANGSVALDNVRPALARLLTVTGMDGLFGASQVTAA